MKSNTPNMNITNQINAGLNDVRKGLIALSDYAKTPDMSDRMIARHKITYQIDLIIEMIEDHRFGKQSVGWSDRKYLVDEEFDE